MAEHTQDEQPVDVADSPEVPAGVPATASTGRHLAMLCALALVAPVVRAAIVNLAVPAGTARRTACEACRTPIASPVLLPGSSRPGGRCHACGNRLGAPPLLVEITIVLAVVAVAASYRSPWQTAALTWWTACAVPLAFIDVSVHRLPDRLTYPAAAGTVGLLGAAAAAGHYGAGLLRGLIAGASAALFFAALTLLLGRRGPGLGDAKLLFSAVTYLAWIGWPSLSNAVLLTFGGQAVCGLALLLARRTRGSLPLGPFLLAGVLLSSLVPVNALFAVILNR